MPHTLLSGMLLMNFFIQSGEKIEFSFGPHYSSYMLYQDDEDAESQWNLGGEIAVHNFVPNIGIKLRASRLLYEPRFVVYFDEIIEYEYIPLTLCTSFNLLPFLKLQWLNLSLETGIGVYFWKGLDNSRQIMILPTGDTMEERDIGFVGGFTLQLRPIKFVNLEFSSLYHYIASVDINKYGFNDKDDKIWENGIGLKIIIP